MKKLLTISAIVALSVLSTGCSDPDGAARTLRSNGYTNVHTSGHAFWACSDSDSFATKFTAISPNGTYVSGAVCKGLFKGSTIRFD